MISSAGVRTWKDSFQGQDKVKVIRGLEAPSTWGQGHVVEFWKRRLVTFRKDTSPIVRKAHGIQ